MEVAGQHVMLHALAYSIRQHVVRFAQDVIAFAGSTKLFLKKTPSMKIRERSSLISIKVLKKERN